MATATATASCTASESGAGDAGEAEGEGGAGGGGGFEAGAAEVAEMDPNFAVIVSFLRLLGPTAALDNVAIDTLALLLADTHQVPVQLEQLFSKLLRKAVKNFRPASWEKCLVKFCHQRGYRQEAWELERFGLKKSSIHIKIKVLKYLLEYQFVCNNKFKIAVNKMENRKLRLNPLGRDDKGRCYWLHRDHRANIRLYREDQDEETWKLIASDRAGVVEIISALRLGKSPSSSVTEPVLNEDSNSVGSPCNQTTDNETDNISKKESSSSPCDKKTSSNTEDKMKADSKKSEEIPMEVDEQSMKNTSTANIKLHVKGDDKSLTDKVSKDNVDETTSIKISPSEINIDGAKSNLDNPLDNVNVIEKKDSDASKSNGTSNDNLKEENLDKSTNDQSDSDDEVIEEKTMIVKGEGSGAECESLPLHYFSEEIEEEVMYITGEGSGNDCMTGNPAVAETTSENQNKESKDDEIETPSNSEEIQADENILERKLKNNIDDTTERKNCTESISKAVDEIVNAKVSENDTPKSNTNNSEESELDSETKNIQSAPLPVTKRFLQNIPKSTFISEALDGNRSNKTKLWSVDSMCGNTSSAESPATTEKNSTCETVLLNKNSVTSSNNVYVDINSTENHTSCDMKDVDKVENCPKLSSTNCDKLNSDLNKTQETEIYKDKSSESVVTKKFFFGQPGCLKLSPDSSRTSTSIEIKEKVVNNNQKEHSTNNNNTQTSILNPDVATAKITDSDHQKHCKKQEEISSEVREDIPVKESQSSDLTESPSNEKIGKEETVPETDLSILKVESDVLLKPIVPEGNSLIGCSEIESEKLIENDIDIDSEMKSIPENERKEVSDTIPPVSCLKHKVDSDEVNANMDFKSTAVKKLKLADDSKDIDLTENDVELKKDSMEVNVNDLSVTEDLNNKIEDEVKSPNSNESVIKSESLVDVKNDEISDTKDKGIDDKAPCETDTVLNIKVKSPALSDTEICNKSNDTTAVDDSCSETPQSKEVIPSISLRSKAVTRKVVKTPKKNNCNNSEVDSNQSRSITKTEITKNDKNDSDDKKGVDAVKKDHIVKPTKHLNNRKRTREESASLSDEEEGKEIKKTKLRQKKPNISQRKKVEEKKVIAESSSEEESDAPISIKEDEKPTAISKNSKPQKVKPKKRAPKKKSFAKSKAGIGGAPVVTEDDPPIRQSRRIAQLKIKEEAQRRQMEEVALRELKAQHKKKNIKEKVDLDWKKSSDEHSSDEAVVKQQKGKGKIKKDKNWLNAKNASLTWNSSSGGNESDSEPGEPEDDFDDQDLYEDILEPKSDHEFSPESDVEGGETIPVRRARTLKKDDEDGDTVDGGCVYCGKADHPEWILLCDSCDAGWHASCLKPVLFLVPEGEWFCPPCNHKSLISALEEQLEEYDEHVKTVEIEDLNRKSDSNESVEKEPSDSEFEESGQKSDDSENSNSSNSSTDSSDDEKIYRLRERRQLPISYRFREYDQLISSAIKEEYKEDENGGAGNQGRGKDISTIIEADKEEKKAMLQTKSDDAVEVSEVRKAAMRARRKPRKLNSLEVLSDDADDNSDEDFKETGWSSSTSEAISTEVDGSSSSHSSDSMPIRRTLRNTRNPKNRRRNTERSEKKKSKRRLKIESSSESSDDDVLLKKLKTSNSSKSADKSSRKSKKKSRSKRDNGENEGGEESKKAKVKYGGLSDSSKGSHDWSPAHRTRQRKYNYMEMPNTESEDEAHKPSGKHMDSSDEYKGESDSCSDSGSSRERNKRKSRFFDEDLVHFQASKDAYQKQLNASTASDLLKGSLIPIVKLSNISPLKSDNTDDMEGLKGSPVEENINNDEHEPGKEENIPMKALTPSQAEKEKKRKEKEEKFLEKEKRKNERIKKKEEKQFIKEQKAKEREEKKQARLANKEQSKGNRKIRPTEYIGGVTNLSVPIPISNMPRNLSAPGSQPHLSNPPHGFIDMRGQPPRIVNPMQMKLDQQNMGPVIQELGNPSKFPDPREQMLNYRSQLSSISPHVRHSESPGNEEALNLNFPDDRKVAPVDQRLQIFPGDGRKIPIIPGHRPSYVGQRILPLNPEGIPGRILPPGYALNNPGPLPPDEVYGRQIGAVAGNDSPNNIPRNGIPLADLTGGNAGLPRHLSPNPLVVSPGLEGNTSHMLGPRGSTPKRRGRGPGKKTLARQAAATGMPEGSSPGPIPSNSPLTEGTLTVAGAPQPFRPNVDPPSIITRMPHMMPPPYRGSSMYSNNSPMYGPPRGPPHNHIPMGGAYRAHPPHPLDPSPSGGGPISMASPGRSSPHHQYPPYQSPSYYAPASTPPQLVSHTPPYPPPHGRFPPPHIPAPPSISPASVNTQDSMEMDDKSKVFQDQPEAGQFPCKPEIKQEPETISIKQSSSPTEELEESASNEDQTERLDEPLPSAATDGAPLSLRTHPQVKHTEGKGDRSSRSRISVTAAARYPQGPYAPQYGPYAPYPPPTSDLPYIHPSMHILQSNQPQPLTPIHRSPLPAPHHPPSHISPIQIPQRPPLVPLPVEHIRPQESGEVRTVPQTTSPSTASNTGQNEEETSEFGGLVSYFSSQQEDDIDT